MENCIFCKIAQKTAGATIVYEDDEIIAFDDISPSAPIHILVVPKEHIESIADLNGNHQGVISKMIFAAKRIAEEKKLVGYKLVFNVGREGGQVIDHLHLHLLGGWGK
jgi:histidine triad (HIT) family protein